MTEIESESFEDWVANKIQDASELGVELQFLNDIKVDTLPELDPKTQSWIFDGLGGVWVSNIPGGAMEEKVEEWGIGWDWLMNDWDN